jgi:hypothetical protein
MMIQAGSEQRMALSRGPHLQGSRQPLLKGGRSTRRSAVAAAVKSRTGASTLVKVSAAIGGSAKDAWQLLSMMDCATLQICGITSAEDAQAALAAGADLVGRCSLSNQGNSSHLTVCAQDR